MQKKHCRFPSSYHDRKSRKSLRSGVCFKLIAFWFLSYLGRTNIETSQLFFCEVIKLASFQPVRRSGFRSWLWPRVGRPRSITARKKKPLIPWVPVKKTDTKYLNYYPVAMLVFFRGNLASSTSHLSKKRFNERLNNGEPNNIHQSIQLASVIHWFWFWFVNILLRSSNQKVLLTL